MNPPNIRAETTAVVGGIALDLTPCLRLPSGEVVISAEDAIDVALQLIKQAVSISPTAMTKIQVANSPVSVHLKGGPLDGHAGELGTFFGLFPLMAYMVRPSTPGQFQYKLTKDTDAGGRRIYEFVQRVPEE